MARVLFRRPSGCLGVPWLKRDSSELMSLVNFKPRHFWPQSENRPNRRTKSTCLRESYRSHEYGVIMATTLFHSLRLVCLKLVVISRHLFSEQWCRRDSLFRLGPVSETKQDCEPKTPFQIAIPDLYGACGCG